MKNMSILFLILFLSCTEMNNKIWSNSEDFKKFEQKASVNGEAALAIYDENFTKNFQMVRDEDFLHDYKRIIYVEGNHYYIGYRNTMDKRGDKIAELHFLAKINATTGEISAVK